MESTEAQTLVTAAMEEPRLPSTVVEPDARPTELECDHFSIRGYVALHQKRDPKLCSLGIFSNQQQYDEHNSNSPLLVAKYQQWNCSNCLHRVINLGQRTSTGTVPMQQDGTNDDCAISIIRTLPYSAGSRRLFSCTRQSSQGNHADQSNVLKSVQECNLKCSSPSDNKAVTVANVPAISAENNVPDTFVEKSVPNTNDLQGSPNNPQICVPDVGCNDSSVHESISGHEGSKSNSGQKSNQVSNQGPQRAAAPKRNVSGLKFYRRKPKKTRLISDIMNPQKKSCAVDTEAEHAENGDVCENSTLKRSMLRTDDLGQVESEGAMQTKVSLGKGKIQQIVSGLHNENIPKNKKKCTVEVQTVLDDIPMDIVELLARKQHERQLMTDADSTQAKTAAIEIPGKDGPNDIFECSQEQQTDICWDEEVTIAYGASNDYATQQRVIKPVEGQYTNDAVNQVQQTSAQSTALTMDPMPTTHLLGHSDLYQKEPMPATHLLGLMDSSTIQGFTNYQNLSSQNVQHNHCTASPNTSHGSYLPGKVKLTLQDLERHEVEKILHRPLRPRPRVGVFGPLLQQEIANWSESCGHSLGYVFSAVNPKHPLPRFGVSQPCAGSTGKTPLDKLVRKDMCHSNRNPADFTVISNENDYMINL